MNIPETIPAWIDGTLRPVEKIDVHRRGLRHKAVSVFLRVNGKLLIQRRALGKYHTPGLWANTCCTHPRWGEEADACAARRLREELGVAEADLEHRGQVEYRADVGGGLVEHEVVEIFLAEPDRRPRLDPNREEVMAVRWVALDRLCAEIAREPERFTPWLRIYLARHARRIFGAAINA